MQKMSFTSQYANQKKAGTEQNEIVFEIYPSRPLLVWVGLEFPMSEIMFFLLFVAEHNKGNAQTTSCWA